MIKMVYFYGDICFNVHCEMFVVLFLILFKVFKLNTCK